MSENRDVYDIIAEMMIDYKKLDLLNDITFEANLLMRSRFVERRSVDLDGFLRLLEEYKDRDIIITSRLNGRRFIAYIEKGTIISTALSDPKTGRRITGLRPLAQLLLMAMQKQVPLRIFVVEEEKEKREEKREETRAEKELNVDLKILERATTIRPPKKEEAVEKPVEKHVIDEKTLEELKQKITEAFEDVLNYKGYRLLGVEIEYREGKIIVKTYVKKKKLFGAAKLEDVKQALQGEVDITLKLMEIKAPYEVIVEKKKKK